MSHTAETVIHDRDAMITWLKQQPPAMAVGYARDACRCPLSEYLSQQLDTPHVQVNIDSVVVDITRYDLPPWAIRLVDRVDDYNFGTPVMAVELLHMLTLKSTGEQS